MNRDVVIVLQLRNRIGSRSSLQQQQDHRRPLFVFLLFSFLLGPLNSLKLLCFFLSIWVVLLTSPLHIARCWTRLATISLSWFLLLEYDMLPLR